MKATFSEFDNLMRIIMNLDNMSEDMLTERMNEWYVDFKDSNWDSIVDWATEYFQKK